MGEPGSWRATEIESATEIEEGWAMLGPARHVLDALADAVTIRAHDHRLVYANRAALEMLGFRSVDELASADPRALLERYEIADEQGTPIALEHLPSVRLLQGEEPSPLLLRSVHRETGDERWSYLKASCLRDASNGIRAAVTIIEDVTEAKRASLRLQFILQAGSQLASSLDYEHTLRSVALLAVPEIADWCAVDLFEGGALVPLAVAHRDPARVALAERLRAMECRELDPRVGLGRVLHTGEPIFHAEVSDAMLVQGARNEEHLRILREIGLRSLVIAPMRGRERTIGALTLVTADSGRRLAPEDVGFLEQIAHRGALAVENARLYSERAAIARTLQRSLLPARLPVIPGWEIATLYRAAGRGNEVGGDFYDFWRARGTWLALIGDVVGKGIDAAALTSLIRHTARAAAEFDPAPPKVLTLVDRALRGHPMPVACTVLCLGLAGARATIVSGGHPLPILLADDRVQEIGEPGTLLGTLHTISLPQRSVVLRPGDTLVAITDGVTDTIGRQGERFGERRLRRVLHHARRESPVGIRERIAAALDAFQVGARTDDTAVVVMRYTGAATRTVHTPAAEPLPAQARYPGRPAESRQLQAVSAGRSAQRSRGTVPTPLVTGSRSRS